MRYLGNKNRYVQVQKTERKKTMQKTQIPNFSSFWIFPSISEVQSPTAQSMINLNFHGSSSLLLFWVSPHFSPSNPGHHFYRAPFIFYGIYFSPRPPNHHSILFQRLQIDNFSSCLLFLTKMSGFSFYLLFFFLQTNNQAFLLSNDSGTACLFTTFTQTTE